MEEIWNVKGISGGISLLQAIRTNKEKLPERIVKQVKAQIFSGELKPGDKLPSENTLCEIFQVSRTSVREAIKELCGLGLLVVKRGSGIFVQPISLKCLLDESYPVLVDASEDFDDIARVRSLLESEIAALAAEHATDEELALMEESISTCEKAIEDGTVTFDLLNESNAIFHRLMARSCGSKVLLYVVQPLWRIMDEVRRLVLTKPNRKLASVKEHRAIIDALKAHDPELAREKMLYHMNKVASTQKGLHD